MKRIAFVFAVVLSHLIAYSQTVTTNPTLPSPDQPVTITFDVTGTSFASKNLNDVWLWAWLEQGATDTNAPTNVNPATSAQSAAKVTRSTSNPNIYTITITATTFFNKPASEISQVGILLKGQDWANGQTADKFITFSQSFSVVFSSPSEEIFFVNTNDNISITANTNQSATITFKKDGAILTTSNPGVTALNYSLPVSESSGSITITAEASNGTATVSKSFKYVVRTATVNQSRPLGIIDGINYQTDGTKVSLSLWAPEKTSVYVLGDFNNWQISPDYQMKKDGEHFWIEVTGLTTGQEYGFQYLVDETVRVADPYADKILDPDDQYIPSTTYPNLKGYPTAALSAKWYFNRVAVLQTAQTAYTWTATDFQKPAKEKLVVYELLIRDFFDSNHRNYQTLIDTLGYFKRLGINAIELMPVMEFNGNEGWGYNPTFMFAPDKYYGTKNKFKEFIDKCHQHGIAVILDIAMNHQDLPNPYVMMDFDFVNMKPEADNKWFNVTATHPFSVFYDMNHESTYTKKYLDTVNHHWLNEYKVDGFRFDLSKGFTQVNNPSNVGAWSAYDASRIAILKRMADKIWDQFPDAYIILEHLSANDEEKELAAYRAAEGKGMMLWGKMTDQYNQLSMGYGDNSDISGISYQSRNWTAPRLVGYMESHDEERLMFKDLAYGNTAANYNVKDTTVALNRQKAVHALFLTVPGPKMIWQFGELGYDVSINRCTDGSSSPDCRLANKPVLWKYQDDARRDRLFDHIAELNRLRAQYDVFTSGDVTITSGAGLFKQITLKNVPYNSSPSSADDMNAVVVANFGTSAQGLAVTFPHTGSWYDYYSYGTYHLNVTGTSADVMLQPGQYQIFTDVPIENLLVTGIEAEDVRSGIAVFPNPATEAISVELDEPLLHVNILSTDGKVFPCPSLGDNRYDVSALRAGFYILRVQTNRKLFTTKFVKN